MSLVDVLAPLLFVREWKAGNNSSSLWGDVDSCIQRGWATTSFGVSRSGQSLISVAVKESCQERRRDLPIGARSLLFSQPDGAAASQLVLRGVNKFSDYHVLEHAALLGTIEPFAAMDGSGGSAAVRVVLQKKMAGFVVLLFSLDGVELEVMSKHSLDGVHVAEGRRILQATLSSERILQLAQHLHATSRVVVCECISPEWDAQHPILESSAPSLVVFAVAHRTSGLELSLPTQCMAAWCAVWGLDCVPHQQVDLAEGSKGALLQRVEAVERSLMHWAEASEGFVLLVEVTPATMSSGCSPPQEGGCYDGSNVNPGLVVPLRLKLKSLRYRLLRYLRSTISGEHQAAPTHEFYNHPYTLALLHWARTCRHSIAEETVMEWVARRGIWRCSLEFEAALCRHKRLRDDPLAAGDVHPLRELTQTVEQCAVRRRFSPHSMVMMCGLPGAGKSTICEELVALVSVASGQTPTTDYAAVVYISRDKIAMDVERAAGITAQSSGHQRRQVKKSVHQRLCETIAQVTRWMANRMDYAHPVLLVLDACHASPAARQMFRSMAPPHMQGGCVCAHVSTGCDPTIAARRAAARGGHDVLRQEDAMQAYLDVSRVFVAPQQSDGPFDVVFEMDSNACTPKCNAQQLLDALHVRRHTSDHNAQVGRQAVRSLTHRDVMALDVVPQLPLCADHLGVGSISNLAIEHAGPVRMPRRGPNTSHARLRPSDAAGTQTRLLDVVAQAMLCASRHGQVVGAPSPPEGAPVGFLARAKQLLSLALHPVGLLSSPTSPDAVVALGHLRWIPGTFVRQDSTAPLQPQDMDVLREALGKRFELSNGDPHVTLCYERGTDAAERAERHLSRLGLRVGQVVSVEATHVLVDPRAVCVLVRLVDVDTTGSADADAPLHITLGHTHHVKPVYCAEMLAAFAAMDVENKNAATTHCKQHNFVSLALNNSLRIQLQMHVELG